MSYYNARVVVVNATVVELGPGIDFMNLCFGRKLLGQIFSL
jgi:hypothetical protein